MAFLKMGSEEPNQQSNESDFLLRNPAVASAIFAKPGEVSFLVRSWARARAREHGLIFADEADEDEDNDAIISPNTAEIKFSIQSLEEEPWDLHADIEQSNPHSSNEQIYTGGEFKDDEEEKPVTITDSDDYDDDEEDLIEPDESTDTDTDETEEDSDESYDDPTWEPRKKKARVCEETQTSN